MKNPKRVLLGVNIDHVATLREARGTIYPDPVQAAFLAEEAGADGITIHPREDRRHIQTRDVYVLASTIGTRMNLEMAVTNDMMELAEEIEPAAVCFVPEKREELTTEGGLDVLSKIDFISQAVTRMSHLGSEVSLFIDPEIEQIKAAVDAGAPVIELHTGRYAEAVYEDEQLDELERIEEAAAFAYSQGLIVNAGHGLNYHNVEAIAAIPSMNELNIGHAIVARALFVGFKQAVKEMRDLIAAASFNDPRF